MQTELTTLPGVKGRQGHGTWPMGTSVAPQASVCGLFGLVSGLFARLLTWGSGRVAGQPGGQMGPKRFKSENSQKWGPTLGGVKRTFWGLFDPFFAVFGPFQPSFSPILGPRWTPTWAQNRSKMTSFKSGHRPFGRVKDLSGPFWARFDQFYGYTGYRIPDTGHRYTGKGQNP